MRFDGYSVTYWSSGWGLDIAQLKFEGSILARFERKQDGGWWEGQDPSKIVATDDFLPALLVERAEAHSAWNETPKRRASDMRLLLETAGLEVESKVRG